MLKGPGAPVAPTVLLAPLRPQFGPVDASVRAISVGRPYPSVKPKPTTSGGPMVPPPTTCWVFVRQPVDEMWTRCGRPVDALAYRRHRPWRYVGAPRPLPLPRAPCVIAWRGRRKRPEVG